MEKWEYKTIDLTTWRQIADINVDYELNRLGDQGWQLVQIIAVENSKLFYFKRKKLYPLEMKDDKCFCGHHDYEHHSSGCSKCTCGLSNLQVLRETFIPA